MKWISLFVALFPLYFVACSPKTGSSEWKSEKSDSLSFIVIGDWGVGGTPAQKRVADAIDRIAQQTNIQFIITTGDNFYPAGVTTVDDPHWSKSFTSVYNKRGHMVPWYPTLGNHDYNGSPAAEIQYSKVNDRWKMRSHYYSFKEKFGKTHAVFAFADMNPFITSYYKEPMPELKGQDTAAQYKWLKKTLSDDEDWKIMIGHQPLYSLGAHGSNPGLINRFKSLLLETGTQFYLAGHDHNLQHIQYKNEPVHYLVSGGGGRGLYSFKSKDLDPLFAVSSHGFMRMTLYEDYAVVYFYDSNGESLYRKEISKALAKN
jgi:tartrate-resistant acid phosphatase type 5